jgi:hypothetical protein
MRKLCLIIIALLVSGCSSTTVFHRDNTDAQQNGSQPDNQIFTNFPAATSKGYGLEPENAPACANALPPFVPWPPLRPTDRYVFPSELVLRFRTVSEFNNFLVTKLREAGYDSFSYFSAPGGFSLATRVEQLDEKRAPVAGTRRWIMDTANGPHSFKEYILSLLRNRRGHFRVFIFVLTNDPRPPRSEDATPEDAIRWAKTGCASIPETLGGAKITGDYVFYVLTYEFSAEKGRNVEQLYITPTPVSDQLKLAGLRLQQ